LKREVKGSLNLLGFVLQINGLLTFIPIFLALIFEEDRALISFLFMGFIFLLIGSLLTTKFKEIEMDFVSASLLISLTYISLSLIGTLPYLWYGDLLFPNSNNLDKFIKALFESTSAYTTTGLTSILDLSVSKSLIFLRSFTQWLGGINIVFLTLLIFITPSPFRVLSQILGFERLTLNLKRSFIEVIKVYFIFTLIFTILLTYLGGVPLFESLNITFSGLSTGGFLPTNNLKNFLNPSSYWIIVAIMLVGSINFSILSKIFGRKIGIVYLSEFYFWILILTIGSLISFFIFKGDWRDTFFHIVSATTTTGFQYVDISQQIDTVKLFFTLLMFFGGSSFSTAGGIKILRILLALGALEWFFKRILLPEKVIIPFRIRERIIDEKEIMSVLFLIMIGILSLIIGTLIFTFYGYSTSDSLFELTSAFATTGLTTGLSALDLPFLLRLILIFEMILGRIEVIPFIVFLYHIFRWGKK